MEEEELFFVYEDYMGMDGEDMSDIQCLRDEEEAAHWAETYPEQIVFTAELVMS